MNTLVVKNIKALFCSKSGMSVVIFVFISFVFCMLLAFAFFEILKILSIEYDKSKTLTDLLDFIYIRYVITAFITYFIIGVMFRVAGISAYSIVSQENKDHRSVSKQTYVREIFHSARLPAMVISVISSALLLNVNLPNYGAFSVLSHISIAILIMVSTLSIMISAASSHETYKNGNVMLGVRALRKANAKWLECMFIGASLFGVLSYILSIFTIYSTQLLIYPFEVLWLLAMIKVAADY